MPNHCTNQLIITGEEKEREKLFEMIKNDEIGIGSIDFNKIIPMPKELAIESGSRGSNGLKIYKEYLELSASKSNDEAMNIINEKYKEKLENDSEMFTLGKQYYENIMNHGYATWYEWSYDNWGTKWNAYESTEAFIEKPNTIEFLTAWGPPNPVIEKLSEMFPSLTISHRFCDEQIGVGVGEIEYENGERTFEVRYDDFSEDAYEIVGELLCMDRDEITEMLMC